MKKNKNKIVCKFRIVLPMLLPVVLVLMSCLTGKPVKRLSDDDGLMFAMIYDQSGSPVSGVSVYLNNRRVVDSDIQGRFILESMKKELYRIRLVKNGYENLEEEFYYIPMQVLYLKMINAAGLLNLAENALDNRDFAGAEAYIDRALAIEPQRYDFLFFKTIVNYMQRRFDVALEILDNMIVSGYIDQSMFRLIEDIRLLQSSTEAQ